jgi:alpha-acetolactate decarboxylase
MDACAPFAVAIRFAPDVDLSIEPVDSLDVLKKRCDQYRRSNNIFYAICLDGEFRHVRMRAVSPPSTICSLPARRSMRSTSIVATSAPMRVPSTNLVDNGGVVSFAKFRSP